MADEPEISQIDDKAPSPKQVSIYKQIIQRVFDRHYKAGALEFRFEREELRETALAIHADGLAKKSIVKNLGDIIYTFRHRQALPAEILGKQPKNRGWIILGDGDGKYRFRLTKLVHIEPRLGTEVIPIPDATPEIIVKYAQNDEQALLAKIRYNRLIDTFLGITTYSLQNHLRTKIPNYGQIEIDELYTGVDKAGRHYIVPVQAKGATDKLGAIQTIQDITYCTTAPQEGIKRRKKKSKDFSRLECRAVSAQTIRDEGGDVIAMFELGFNGNDVSVKEERHYRLVSAEVESGLLKTAF